MGGERDCARLSLVLFSLSPPSPLTASPGHHWWGGGVVGGGNNKNVKKGETIKRETKKVPDEMMSPVQYISSVPPIPPPLFLIPRQGNERMTPNLADNKKQNHPSSSFPAFRPPPPVRSKISTLPFLPHACHITSCPCIHIFKMGLTGTLFKKRIARYTTLSLPLCVSVRVVE